MKRLFQFLILVPLCLLAASAANSQDSPMKADVSMGHLHYNVRDLEANRKFWIALGAKPVTIGKIEALKFPNLLIVLKQADSSGGTEGSVINHVGFRVPNVVQTKAKMEAAGYKTGPSREGGDLVGNVFTPEDERIELLQDMTDHGDFITEKGQVSNRPMSGEPIMFHHIHYYLPVNGVPAARDWYLKNFGGVLGKRYHYVAIDLPGVNLNFSETPDKMAPTKGRRLDHIGFEVKNLEAFCKKLQANGVKFDIAYKKNANGLATAFLTDPWGTYIELTEGLKP
jgi:extradiol dioxygenase family protein